MTYNYKKPGRNKELKQIINLSINHLIYYSNLRNTITI